MTGTYKWYKFSVFTVDVKQQAKLSSGIWFQNFHREIVTCGEDKLLLAKHLSNLAEVAVHKLKLVLMYLREVADVSNAKRATKDKILVSNIDAL